MNASNPKSWARKHKKTFANSFVTNSGAEPQPQPAAIFMAGVPGAGKTEFTKNILSDLIYKVVRIDMDEIATHIENYNPLQADAFREAATDLLNAVYDRTTHRKLDFIMDGTLRSKNSLNSITRALTKGYVVKVVYIYQKPDIAWSFTQAREEVERRAIEKDGFIQSYFEVRHNIEKLLTDKSFSDVSIDLVVKDKTNKHGTRHENVTLDEIDKLIDKTYNKDELERILQ